MAQLGGYSLSITILLGAPDSRRPESVRAHLRPPRGSVCSVVLTAMMPCGAAGAMEALASAACAATAASTSWSMSLSSAPALRSRTSWLTALMDASRDRSVASIGVSSDLKGSDAWFNGLQSVRKYFERKQEARC